MKATIVGAAVPAKTLRAACAKTDVPTKDVRTIGTRTWVLLPGERPDSMLPGLAEALGTGMMVIEVDVPAGARGDGLVASRATYRGVEEDVTQEAREALRKWTAEHARTGFDDVTAASDVAWALIEADRETNPPSSNVEDVWAQALFDRLLGAGSIELRGKHSPVASIAQVLQNPGRDLGARLLSELIDSTAIDEVYADADELARIARETRPKR